MTEGKQKTDRSADPSMDSAVSPQADSLLRQPVPRSFSGGGRSGGQAAQPLRKRAEEIARAGEDKTLDALSPKAARQMLHELRVHQIELEMQNEELRRVEAELEASRARYFDLYDLAPVGYLTLSEQGLVLEANLTAATLLGVARGALVKQPVTRFIFWDDRDIYYLHRKKLFEKGAPQVCELRLVKKDGTLFWARLEATAAQDAGSGDTVYRVVMSDITERKQAEEALKKTMLDLERSNKELEQFAYVASHDLQEPLRMVTSFTQLLAKRYQDKLDANINEYIRYIFDGTNRMQKKINDLLSYSRVGLHGKPFEPTDCTGILNQTLTDLKVAIDENEAIITHDALPVVMGDESQLVQLFQNLIENGIKFRSKEAPRIHISAQESGHEWIFAVQDNGIGIDPQYNERIFVIFQRLHGREEYPGTGIGLTICKKIVERHGGRVWVDSQPGNGSTFHFTIPKTGGLKL